MEEVKLQPVNQSIVEAENKLIVVLVEEVNNLSIKSQSDYDCAGELRIKIKTKIKKLDELRKSATVPLDNAKTIIMGWFKPLGERLTIADRILETGRLTYSREQERIRAEAEEKLRIKAEAEEAKKRAIKEAQEAKWRAEEEAKRKEAARQEAIAANAKNEKVRKAAEEAAAKARAEADKAAKLAEERKEQAANVQVIAPVLASIVIKSNGIGARKNWKFRIIDDSIIPRRYLTPDLLQIGKEVRACGESLSIPGIEIYPEDKEVVRTRV
ncbi:MAG: hypothetical protein WAX79_01840 [Candidatus Omnitrophota bacterium]